MKNIIILSLLLATSSLYATTNAPTKKPTEEKSLTIKAHVVKMIMSGNKLYQLELREFAAVYHADEKFAPCLQLSIKENKKVSLTVSSQSLIVLECKVD